MRFLPKLVLPFRSFVGNTVIERARVGSNPADNGVRTLRSFPQGVQPAARPVWDCYWRDHECLRRRIERAIGPKLRRGSAARQHNDAVRQLLPFGSATSCMLIPRCKGRSPVRPVPHAPSPRQTPPLFFHCFLLALSCRLGRTPTRDLGLEPSRSGQRRRSV